MFFPLASSISYDPVNLTTGCLKAAQNAGIFRAFANIGVGIGAVMLLFIVIYYIIAILDGGKFQLKMLLPLLLFLLIQNFGLVSTPVLKFTTQITSACAGSCKAAKEALLESKGATDMMDLFYKSMYPEGLTPEEKETVENLTGEYSSKDAAEAAEDKVVENSSGALSKLGEKIRWKFMQGVRSIEKACVMSVSTSANANDQANGDTEGITIYPLSICFMGLFAAILSFVCSAVAIALAAMGTMMTSVIVAFGPITWAFALFPGRLNTIMSWFIRICQFALYAPICYLVDALAAEVLSLIFATSGAGFLALFAILIADIVCLTSVPTIASMIIEGASGAVSLSSGLQSIASTASAAGSLGTTMLAFGAGKDNMLQNFFAGFKERGLVGFAREMFTKRSDGKIAGLGGAMDSTTVAGQKSRGFGRTPSDATRNDIVNAIRERTQGGASDGGGEAPEGQGGAGPGSAE